jgi:SagB-type dehydrogenase family enzyme
MFHINLPVPIPRKARLATRKYQYPVLNKRYLPIPKAPRGRPFFDILLERRTRRDFRELSDYIVGEFLWYSAKTIGTQVLSNGHKVQHRCCPSAGGIHPIDVLVLDAKNAQLALYDPVGHAFQTLQGPPREIRQLHDMTGHIVDPGAGRIFWFAAEFSRTLDLYEGGENLVWRDTGALIATFCYVAEALNLSCCPIGATGEPFISQFLESDGMIEGVGGCVVGARDS